MPILISKARARDTHVLARCLVVLGLCALSPLPAAEPNGAAPSRTLSGEPQAAAGVDAASAAEVRLAGLLDQAEALRGAGQLAEAEASLDAAAEVAAGLGVPLLSAIVELAAGELAALQGRTDAAERLLSESRQTAERLGSAALAAAAANALGNLAADRGSTDAAAAFYRQALSGAEQAGDAGLEAAARRNLAGVIGANARVERELTAASRAALRVADPAERAELLLSIAEAAREAMPSAAATRIAETSLIQALQAEPISAPTKSRLLATLAALREDQSQPAAAIALLEAAIITSAADAHQALFQWHWRLARLRRGRGEQAEAIAAYRQAVGHLQQIRALIPIDYRDGRSSFRVTFAPLYLELADLLLRRARQPINDRDRLLREARDTIELFKLDEIRDYLRETCILPGTGAIEEVIPEAAVIYPIAFPDRLELLLSIGRHIHLQTVPIGREALFAQADALVAALRAGRDAPAPARALHRVLLAPIAPLLETAGVDTLIFVPDAALRAVPLAALRGAQGYLIEDYAVATLPSARLLADAPALDSDRGRMLLAGLSRPGPVVDELPAWWLAAMQAQHGRSPAGAADDAHPATSRAFIPSAPPPRQVGPAPAPLDATAAADALALPGVAQEIRALADLAPATVLLDEHFRLRRLEQTLGSRPFATLHIASHGLFAGALEDSFVLTYDRRLDIDRLTRLLRQSDPARRLDLLVLSACETAEGDDRAPLGFSGVVARQFGANSVVGSLWMVDDQATRALMQVFYQSLMQQGIGKAQALRQAQLALMRQARFGAPMFWAPFTLVGDPR